MTERVWANPQEVLESLQILMFHRGDEMDVYMREDSFIFIQDTGKECVIVVEFHNLAFHPTDSDAVLKIADIAEEMLVGFEGETKHFIF